MRCLSPAEVEATFTDPKFNVSLKHEWYRAALHLDPSHADRQVRIAAEQPSDLGAAPYFVARLNRWLPTNQARLLWADHWEMAGSAGESANAIVAAAWRGLGEERPLRQAPGLNLDPQNWHEDDLSAISSSHAEALGLLVGVTATLMMTYSDGWLISAACSDRIEFWEGHFFFHSDNPEKLRQADEIFEEFSCKRWKS